MIRCIIVYAMKSIHKSTYIRWNISFKSLTVLQCLYFIVLCVVLTRTVVLSLYNEILLNGSHYTVVKHYYKWTSFDEKILIHPFLRMLQKYITLPRFFLIGVYNIYSAHLLDKQKMNSKWLHFGSNIYHCAIMYVALQYHFIPLG